MISKLHYISQQTPDRTHVQAIEEACRSGCDWVQLRVKNAPDAAYLSLALAAKEICQLYGARLIINDNVAVAKAAGAHGVHLGKEDMPTAQAREILGKRYLIGGTANTFEDVLRLAAAKVDYIGMGPFRFTTTKEKLSPILGLAGYMRTLQHKEAAGIAIPIIAIGGIVLDDVAALLETGVHGVAISGLITKARDKKQIVDQLKDKLYRVHSPL